LTQLPEGIAVAISGWRKRRKLVVVEVVVVVVEVVVVRIFGQNTDPFRGRISTNFKVLTILKNIFFRPPANVIRLFISDNYYVPNKLE
jgi:hypothetical protein